MIAAVSNGPGAADNPLATAVARARRAAQSGDAAGAVAAQEEAVDLARDAGEARDALVSLSVLLFNLAGYYSAADRHDDAVRALEEVVALDERTGHPDLESDRAALAAARQVAALTPDERATLQAAAREASGPNQAAIAEHLQTARAAAERGHLAAAIAAQEEAIALLRDGGADEELRRGLAVQLYNLAGFYGNAGRHAEVVATLKEVVALAEHYGPDQLRELAPQALAAAQEMAALSPEELAALEQAARQAAEQLAAMDEDERAGLLAAASRAQIEQLAAQTRDAGLVALRGEGDRSDLAGQMERVAAQAAGGEEPGSPWMEVALFIRAVVALLRGEPIPPVPVAYAGHFAALQDAAGGDL
jgi:tetratricopeptide (TPR) repeat protein